MENKDLVVAERQNVIPSIWNDEGLMKQAYAAAKYLANSDLVPVTFRKPENCLIALEYANKTGLSPLTVMQNLYVVKGKPSWSGQMCIALVNGCGRFTPLEFEFVGEKGKDSYGCYAYATRLDNNKTYYSDAVTIAMAKGEGWFDKDGSKWKTMPVQMMQYRAGAFFARVHCPDVLLGLPLADELNDIAKEKTAELNEMLNEVLNEDNR